MPRKKDLPYKTEGDIFATRLREIMEERKTNQTKLSAQIKEEQGQTIQRQTISQYMNGQSKPDTERLTMLCNALNVSSDYLIGLAEESTADPSLRAICEYTGLTEDSINSLIRIKKYCSGLEQLNVFLPSGGMHFAHYLSRVDESLTIASARMDRLSYETRIICEKKAEDSRPMKTYNEIEDLIKDIQSSLYAFTAFCYDIPNAFCADDVLGDLEDLELEIQNYLIDKEKEITNGEHTED